MKQKNAQIKGKANAKPVQKGNNMKQKKEKNLPVEKIANAAGQLKAGAGNKNQKKNAKLPVKAAPPKKVEEEEQVDSDNEDDSGADVEADEPISDAEAEVDEDQDAASEIDDAEEGSDDDDEGPTEVPIAKVETPNGVPKIKTGEIPKNMPSEQVIFVQNLPKKTAFKQVDLVEIFAKFGTVHTIRPCYQNHRSTALIAFTTAEAAAAALAANKTEIKGSKIKVSTKSKSKAKKDKYREEKNKEYEEKRKQTEESKDRIVFIKNLKQGTTKDQVREHFAECGDMELMNVVCRKGFTFAFLTFKEVSSVAKALKLHNSVLNDATIGVFVHGDDSSKASSKDPKRTILVKNVQQLESYPGDKLEGIFAKCGEIESLDVLCRKNVLAFVTFKDEKSVKKALKLSGTTAEDLQLELGEYQIPSAKPKTTVFLQNVKPGVTEQEIRDLFAATGEIETIFLKGGFSIIKFKDVDGFCKSFLLNESNLAGQPIFLEPFSEKKQQIIRKKQRPTFGKRKHVPYDQGDNKKLKNETE